ncbi:putative 3-ketoacyl-CoA thiolase B [Laetiporus sulphureus 93-53]|uniref:Putative 3-ketoacyl-CoA thiolase B n=1 Tax=Laetiporus sulphureus 93-53 TaxID=1314785 RepID=A0A165CG82_9APHY|nr:putative 3-ketoacyl-CoA thiolase B [Laetiporus sulphureus 93-53]KZT02753.1 putative 3-ketoacyl-CoA thiolase B [Laetiporus sulphureus 93-53]
MFYGLLRRGTRLWVRSMATQARGASSILEKKLDDVVITFAKRTALGRSEKGQLKDIPVDELMQALIKVSLQKSKLDPAKVEDICVGTCHPPSPTYISRAAAIAAGIPAEVPVFAVNRLCGSGLQAIRIISNAIQAGHISVGMAIGVESMSLHPRPTPQIVDSVGANTQAYDCVQPMGWTSEVVAQAYKISREKQDQYALISHSRAEQASDSGFFAEEIVPIELRGTVISVDDTIRRGTTLEGLSKLCPSWPEWGEASSTAGNSSGLGDGAALCILTTRKHAEREGFHIVGKYVASTFIGVEPRYMGIAPIVAVPKVLAQTGLTQDDVDVYEINEAFASQFAYCVEKLQIPMDKINPNGGSIALTHPLGMTGARQVVTGLAQLRRQGGKILCTSMCIGSGMGGAGIFVNEANA